MRLGDGGELLTTKLIRMSKRCELQKEYYQQYGNYKGNGKYSDKYVSWLENEVLALRQLSVSKRFNFPNFIAGVMVGITICIIIVELSL